MNKLFVPFIITLIGLTSVVNAQAPCFTVIECETLRNAMIQPGLSRSTAKKITKRIDAQISVLRSYWPENLIINGVRWSNLLNGKYENQSLDLDRSVINGVIQQSEATQGCSNIGGKLPSEQQYRDLAAHWRDESIVPAFFKRKMNNRDFWSSTVAESHLNVDAFYFIGEADGGAGLGRSSRIVEKYVRCVAR